MKNIIIKRKDNEFPYVTEMLGWKYHHIGVPTKKSMPGERYISHLKLFVSGFDTSPYGIEWMRFEENSPVSKLVQTVPHIAFEVESLDKVLKDFDFEIISEPSIPSDGVRIIMIKHNGAPVELMEFNKKSNK